MELHANLPRGLSLLLLGDIFWCSTPLISWYVSTFINTIRVLKPLKFTDHLMIIFFGHVPPVIASGPIRYGMEFLVLPVSILIGAPSSLVLGDTVTV